MRRIFSYTGSLVLGCTAAGCWAAERDVEPTEVQRDTDDSESEVANGPLGTLTDSELPDPLGMPDDPCPQIASHSCPDQMVRDTRLLIPASLAGETAVFGAMSRVRTDIGVLGKRWSSDGDEIFILVADVPNTELIDGAPVIETFTVTPMASAPKTDRIVALAESMLDDRFVAVLCGGGGCFLAASSSNAADSAEFLPIEGGEIPDGFDPSDAVVAYDTTVVVGDGIALYRGGQWEMLINPGDGRRFISVDGHPVFSNDIEPERAAYVAVGENGRLATGKADTWQEHESGVFEDLLDVKLSFDGDLYFMAVGRSGRILRGTAESQISCTAFDGDLTRVGLVSNYWEPEYNIISKDGEVIFYPRESSDVPACLAGRLEKPVLDFEIFSCGIVENRVYLLESGVYGGLGCAYD